MLRLCSSVSAHLSQRIAIPTADFRHYRMIAGVSVILTANPLVNSSVFAYNAAISSMADVFRRSKATVRYSVDTICYSDLSFHHCCYFSVVVRHLFSRKGVDCCCRDTSRSNFLSLLFLIGEVTGTTSQTTNNHLRREHSIAENTITGSSRCIVCGLCSFACPTDCLFVGKSPAVPIRTLVGSSAT